MKPILSTLLLALGLATPALAQAACPTATRTIQNRSCNKSCPFSGCTWQTTIANPCGCPSAVPTATLIVPCEAECPYLGCDIDFRVSTSSCRTTTTTTTRQTPTTTPRPPTTTTTPRSTSTRTSTTTYPTGIVTSIIVLPTRTTTTSSSTTVITCPRVTSTTRPADCAPIRCPVPTCMSTSTMQVPCGCTPRTVWFVTGCQTECPTGCATRTATSSQAC
ncbi:hypothetical protein VTJ04DRAFT_2352 [Mycothermus thermophilus]|uniref:uncharacterized protein n=1 Tax=Humicola insolens TaxID=85995 RepID=UPI003741EFE7